MIPFILYRSLWWLHGAWRFIVARLAVIAFVLVALWVLAR